jgi:hypothetical protein
MMKNLAITIDDLQVPTFKSKIMTHDTHNEDGTLRPLVIETIDDKEFKVCDVISSLEGVIVFSIEEITELDDVIDNCVTIAMIQKLTQFWQDFDYDEQVANIHLVHKHAFDSISSAVLKSTLNTFSYN